MMHVLYMYFSTCLQWISDDFNRVQLDTKDETNKYINASFIKVSGIPKCTDMKFKTYKKFFF